jgi:AbiV family abortive infection protein
MKKKLDAYRGKLNAAQIAAGINAASENAKRIAEDAQFILEAGRLPTAASLAILSIEEAGKASILRALALATTEEEVLDEWRNYRAHTKKNVAWILPQLAASGVRKLDDLKPMFQDDSEHPYILDQIKQIGVYTDCLGKAHWSLPKEVIDEPLAKMLVQTAKILARASRVTEKEIELWIKHIGPVWKKDPHWMKQALINWYADMQQHGLVTEGKNEMEQFIKVGIVGNESSIT